ncbi:NB-ARC domains-containing protein, partial [Tanacetum coccineum]
MAQEVVTSLVQNVVNKLFGIVIKEISYMTNCSKNFEDLKREYEKLMQMKGRVQQQITVANDKGDGLLAGVKDWVANADSHISEAKVVIDEFEANAKKKCFHLGMCINLRTLYHYGKKAANKTSSLLQVQKDGETFGSCVSVPTPRPGVLDSYERRKTTLAKEVAVEVKSLFDAVEFITVSQNADLKRIKEEVEVAAKRIIKGDKILVILDDAWGELKLDEVCIPCGPDYKNCKILLTSRSKDVCETMKATRLISVDSLPPEEAWILFKRVVGDTVETDEKLKKIAEK